MPIVTLPDGNSLDFTKKVNVKYNFTQKLKKRKIFLSVGRLSKRKNQIEILKTFLYIKNNDKENIWIIGIDQLMI